MLGRLAKVIFELAAALVPLVITYFAAVNLLQRSEALLTLNREPAARIVRDYIKAGRGSMYEVRFETVDSHVFNERLFYNAPSCPDPGCKLVYDRERDRGFSTHAAYLAKDLCAFSFGLLLTISCLLAARSLSTSRNAFAVNDQPGSNLKLSFLLPLGAYLLFFILSLVLALFPEAQL